MNLRFFVDPATDQPHIYNHDVDESEVQDILEMPAEDRAGRDGARVAIGRTTGGRYLRVIYRREPASDEIVVITAYDLRGKPLRAFRRRKRRKRK